MPCSFFSRFQLSALAIMASALFSITASASAEDAKEQSLFDGKTLEGWEGDTAIWRVEDGVISGGSLTEKRPKNDFLVTKNDYANFELRLKIRLQGSDGMVNSGIQVRSQRIPDNHEMIGYQVDAGDGWWGKLYDESRRNKVIAEPADAKAVNDAIKPNDWNEYRIRCEGPRLQSWINGVPALDYTENDISIPLDGKIGIQVHSGGKVLVQVKDVFITPLPESAAGTVFRGAQPLPAADKPSPLTPEEQLSSFSLPPGFEIELVAAESEGIGKFITVDWDQKGRMWTMTALEYPVDANESAAQAEALYASKAKDKVLVFDQPFAKGPHKPRVFADGLAIPLGLLPLQQKGQDGVLVQHGSDIHWLGDSDGDGIADKRESRLAGFGIQDSHLLPHQFMRAPGNWIWMAQGAFNSGKVKTQGGTQQEVQFDRARMARFKADGAAFEITAQGPCNTWGLVINGVGEAFMQEANDYGFPVMPFHRHANYQGCSNMTFKSYAPEFPALKQQTPFKMGGTGLSGLALSDARDAWPQAYADVMYVANPITRKIQALKIHNKDGSYELQKLPDFIESNDPWFRPVAIHFGPDGCLYIVDWYNQVISHNEVPRNHPDRDKVRGRIWRVKHKEQTPFLVPDLTQVEPAVLVDLLGGSSLRQSHLAWQAITDRKLTDLAPALRAIIANREQGAYRRIASLWALEGLNMVDADVLKPLLLEANRNLRREAVRLMSHLKDQQEQLTLLASMMNDKDAEVRAEVIHALASHIPHSSEAITLLVRMAKEPLTEPVNGQQYNGAPRKVGVAYDREFERYLVRLYLEQQPALLAQWLDSADAKDMHLESLLVATLSLSPKESAPRVAALLPKLQRAPLREEILRLAEHLDAPGVAPALQASLENPATSSAVLAALVELRTRLDAALLQPMLVTFARDLLKAPASKTESYQLALSLIEGFQLEALHPDILDRLKAATADEEKAELLRTLRETGSREVDLFATYSKPDRPQAVSYVALTALASASHENSGSLLVPLLPASDAALRRDLLNRLASHPHGAHYLVKTLLNKELPKEDVDGALLDKLQAVLGNDPEMAKLWEQFEGLFKPVLALDGTDNAWSKLEVALQGPFTLETWINLSEGIGNADSILGVPGELSINFYDSRLRVWIKDKNDVVTAKKPMVPDLWTHVAVTRNADGIWKLYIDGEPEAVSSEAQADTRAFNDLRLGWSLAAGGTAAMLDECRIWNIERSADEIRKSFDRKIDSAPSGLVFAARADQPWGQLQQGASIKRTSDLPPIMSAEEAEKLEAKFTHFRKLAETPGEAQAGKAMAALCLGCHQIGSEGIHLGPNLSGAGAMGTEALLRNLITPNAAMEHAYRIYRVELTSGEVIDAFLVSTDNTGTVIKLPGGIERRIQKADIRSSKYLRRSLMPEGLLDAMSPEQVSALFTYLRTLK